MAEVFKLLVVGGCVVGEHQLFHVVVEHFFGLVSKGATRRAREFDDVPDRVDYSKLPTKSHHKNEKCSPDTTIGLPTAVLQQLPPMHVLLRGPHGAANDYTRQLLANGLSDYLCRCTEEALTVCCTDAMYLPHQVAALATVHEKVHFVCALAFPTEGVLLAVEDVWKQDKYVKVVSEAPTFLPGGPFGENEKMQSPLFARDAAGSPTTSPASLVFVDSRKSLLEMQVEDAYNGVLRSELAAQFRSRCPNSNCGEGEEIPIDALYVLMQDTASPKPEHQALLRKYRLPLQLRTTKWELAQWYWNDELRAFCVDALKLGEEDQGVRTALTQCGIKSVAMAQQRIPLRLYCL